MKLQFHGESRLVAGFFGLDRMLLPSVADVLPTWDTAWAEEFLSGDACALLFSHMSSIPLLSSMLMQLPEDFATNILWRFVESIKTHRLEHIYSSSFLDYSTLCLNLAELIHLFRDSNSGDMYGEIVCSLLYPGFSQPSSFVSDGRLWKLIEKLLARGANIGLPFRAAMVAGEWHDMVQLIECGFNPGTDSLAMVLAESPYSRLSPSLDLCHVLVDQGADVNANYRDSDYPNWLITPLIAACIPGELPLINWLLSAKANVDSIPMRHDDPRISHASCSDREALGDIRLRTTSSPSTNTELEPIRLQPRSKEDPVPEKIWYSTPLIEACARGHDEICEALVAAGANINAVMKPYVGRFGTALVAACAQEYERICWILLKDPAIDITTATWRIRRARECRREYIEPINDPIYTNPLVTAASSGHYHICLELIERGADVNAIPLDTNGEFHTEGTALIRAAACGHFGICKLLVLHGADVNIVVPEAAHYPTALFAAVEQGQLMIIKWLLSQGAEINHHLLSRFPDFCKRILDGTCLSAEEFNVRFYDTKANGGMILAELASRLVSSGIRVNRDVIRSEGSIKSIEALSALGCESRLSDEIPERASQQGGSMNLRVMFGFLTEAILEKHRNETRSYNLVSALSCLNFDVLPESRFRVGSVIVQIWLMLSVPSGYPLSCNPFTHFRWHECSECSSLGHNIPAAEYWAP
jgi:ankyrin repeat protein